MYGPSPTRPASFRTRSRNGEGPEGANHIVCGFLGCDSRPFNPLLDALPRQISTRLSRPTHPRRLVGSICFGSPRDEDKLAGERAARPCWPRFARGDVCRSRSALVGARLSEGYARLAFWIARTGMLGQALQLIHSTAGGGLGARQTLPAKSGCRGSVFADRFAHYVGVYPNALSRPGGVMQLAARRFVKVRRGSASLKQRQQRWV